MAAIEASRDGLERGQRAGVGSVAIPIALELGTAGSTMRGRISETWPSFLDDRASIQHVVRPPMTRLSPAGHRPCAVPSRELESWGRGGEDASEPSKEIRLPVDSGPSLSPGLNSESPSALVMSKTPGIPLAGAHVLLVDDDRDQRTSMEMLLSQAGTSVVAVGSARDALAATTKVGFDMLILDVVLPDGRGYDLLKNLRSLGPSSRTIPAIALSGYDSQQNQDRIREAGFDAYLVKPVSYAQLIENLVRLLGKRGPSIEGAT